MDNLKQITLTIFILASLQTVYTQEKVIDAFKQSYQLETTGKYNEATESLKQVYNENSYEINLRLGWLSYLSGHFTESIAYYNNAISKLPLAIEARLGLVLPLSAMGNWNQIIEQYQFILDVDPQNTIVNYRMGVIYYERKQYEKAETYIKKVVNLYPFDHDSLLMLAWIKYRQGNFNEAKILFHKVLLYNPSDSSAQEGLALIK